MASYLDDIVAWHRARAAEDRRDLDELATAAGEASRRDPPRPFLGALSRGGETAVIAEVKRRSPSRGDLAPALDPAGLAKSYEAGGAACLSVLTDGPHFSGSPEDLAAARAAVGLPVLRKDFTVQVADVYDARLMGADAVLLIAAVLSDAELEAFLAAASGLEMAALVEVHDEAEAARALSAGADLVGVNQRDLRTFEVDTARACRVAGALEGVVRVAESGIRTPADVAELARAGYDAVLVGESLVRAPDPGGLLRALSDAGRGVLECG